MKVVRVAGLLVGGLLGLLAVVVSASALGADGLPTALVAFFGGILIAAALFAVLIAVLVRRNKRAQAEQVAALTAGRPGWAVLHAFPSAEVSATLTANGTTKPGPANLLYGRDGVELWFGTDRFVALRWAAVVEVDERDIAVLGTRSAQGIRFRTRDGRTLDVRLFPSRELRRQHPGLSLQGAALAELLAVRGGAHPAVLDVDAPRP